MTITDYSSIVREERFKNDMDCFINCKKINILEPIPTEFKA